jgi:uncharacterized membrane protein AbrB (regulator of aidB expression)
MAGKKNIGMIIIITAAVLISLAFITAIANDISTQTSYQTQTNETVSINTARLGGNQVNSSVVFSLSKGYLVTAKNLPISDVVVKNITGATIGSGNYTTNLTAGTIAYNNNTYMVSGGGLSNTTYVTYNYASTFYVENQGSRTVISLILLFAALGLVGFVIVEVIKSDGMQSLLSMGKGGAREVSE